MIAFYFPEFPGKHHENGQGGMGMDGVTQCVEGRNGCSCISCGSKFEKQPVMGQHFSVS